MKKVTSDKPRIGSSDLGQGEPPVESLFRKVFVLLVTPGGLIATVLSGVILLPIAYNWFQTPSPQALPAAKASKQQAGNDSPFKSIEAFAQEYNKLGDQILERDLFAKRTVGTTVRWSGKLLRFGPVDRAHGERIWAIIQSQENEWTGFHATFSKEWKTYLYSLQQGDKVLVEGRIFSIELPEIIGTKIERVK